MANTNIPRYLPFCDWNEWISVKNGLYSHDDFAKSHACEIASMWRSRGRVPHSADCAAQLVEVELKSVNWRSELELKLVYSMTIIRAVNGLVDVNQQGYFAESVLSLAERLGLPGWIVELRHDATHNQLPSLSVLKAAARHLLGWFLTFYWQPQFNLLQTLSNRCLPASGGGGGGGGGGVAADSAPSSSSSSVVAGTFESYLADASPTFLSDIFVPLFISATVQAPYKSCESLKQQSAALQKETAKQKRIWWPRITDTLSKYIIFFHPLYCRLLSAAMEAAQLVERGGDELQALWSLDLAEFWLDSLAQFVTENVIAATKTRYSANNPKTKNRDDRAEAALEGEFREHCASYGPLVATVARQVEGGLQLAVDDSAVAIKLRLLADKCTTFYADCIKMTVAAGDGASCTAATDGGVSLGKVGSSAELDEMEQFLRQLDGSSSSGDCGGAGGGGGLKRSSVSATAAEAANKRFRADPTSGVGGSVPTVLYRDLVCSHRHTGGSGKGQGRRANQGGGISVCADYPVWPLGYLPGESDSNAVLYSLSETCLSP